MENKHRALVVDDEPRNVRLITRLLSKDFVFETAATGEEALELIPKFRPDLILLDIVMPGIDGYETCRRIRQDKRFRFTKIVLVSGNHSLEERLAGYEAGADEYVAKPFEAEELRAKINVFIRLKSAEEVDEIKGDLLTLFSHETKTPLSGIIGLSELLKNDADLDDNTRKCADMIHRSGGQLLEFVQKTCLLCELKTGTQPTVRADRVAARYEKVVEIIESTLMDIAETKFVLEAQEDIELTADWDMLDQVIGYLLHNGAKYSPPGSTVTTKLQKGNGRCTISVKNPGDGIDPEWIDKIFDEFAIQDVLHHHGGQGLSLAISKHVVELHGGTISVTSTPGQGAEFTIELPME